MGESLPGRVQNQQGAPVARGRAKKVSKTAGLVDGAGRAEWRMQTRWAGMWFSALQAAPPEM